MSCVCVCACLVFLVFSMFFFSIVKSEKPCSLFSVAAMQCPRLPGCRIGAPSKLRCQEGSSHTFVPGTTGALHVEGPGYFYHGLRTSRHVESLGTRHRSVLIRRHPKASFCFHQGRCLSSESFRALRALEVAAKVASKGRNPHKTKELLPSWFHASRIGRAEGIQE